MSTLLLHMSLASIDSFSIVPEKWACATRVTGKQKHSSSKGNSRKRPLYGSVNWVNLCIISKLAWLLLLVIMVDSEQKFSKVEAMSNFLFPPKQKNDFQIYPQIVSFWKRIHEIWVRSLKKLRIKIISEATFDSVEDVQKPQSSPLHNGNLVVKKVWKIIDGKS